MKNVIKTAIVAVFVSLLTVYVYEKVVSNDNSATLHQSKLNETNSVFAKMAPVPAITTDFTAAAEKSISAVVHVKVKVETIGSSSNSIFDYFFGPGYNQPIQPRVQEGSGSGVIISSDGYIVTNNHVVDKSNNVEVVLNDRRSYDARVIGTDPQTDLALIKIEGSDLPTLTFGNSEALKIGEWVLAVGNPFSLSTTVTAGIVSAKARGLGIISSNTPMGIESFIQTDAAVNPGNSGGAMVNTSGELVGINTAIASPTGAYAGYSFAIPASIVKKIVGDLMEYGEVQRALLGVSISDITAEKAKAKGLDILKGIYVEGLDPNGAANEAGMKEGDVIVSLNGVEVSSISELQEQVSKYRPGDKVKVDFIRNKKERSVDAILRNQKGDTKIVKSTDLALLGARFKPVSDQLKRSLSLSYGVQIYDLQPGKFMKHDVHEGYIITKINDRKVYSIEDVKLAVDASDGAIFLTGIYPNGRIAYYAINLKND